MAGNVQQPDIRFDACFLAVRVDPQMPRSEEHTSELQSLREISYAVFCLKTYTHCIDLIFKSCILHWFYIFHLNNGTG